MKAAVAVAWRAAFEAAGKEPPAWYAERQKRYGEAVALFQVSIALGAVAALTHNRLVWLGSMAVGAVGIVTFALALLG